MKGVAQTKHTHTHKLTVWKRTRRFRPRRRAPRAVLPVGGAQRRLVPVDAQQAGDPVHAVPADLKDGKALMSDSTQPGSKGPFLVPTWAWRGYVCLVR